jgi:hypothetical protein
MGLRLRRFLAVVIFIAAICFIVPSAAHAMQVEGEIAAIDLDGETLVVVRSGNEFKLKCDKFLLEGYKVGDRVNVIYREKLIVKEGATAGANVVVRIKKREKKVNIGC